MLGKPVHHEGHEYCDLCECEREAQYLDAESTQIIWFECGHILVIQDDDVTNVIRLKGAEK